MLMAHNKKHAETGGWYNNHGGAATLAVQPRGPMKAPPPSQIPGLGDFTNPPVQQGAGPAKARATSQIPGLGVSEYSNGSPSEQLRPHARDSDSDYVKLSKQGGRPDLLYGEADHNLATPASRHKRVDWYYQDDIRAEQNTTGATSQQRRPSNLHTNGSVLPDYMVYQTKPSGDMQTTSNAAYGPKKGAIHQYDDEGLDDGQMVYSNEDLKTKPPSMPRHRIRPSDGTDMSKLLSFGYMANKEQPGGKPANSNGYSNNNNITGAPAQFTNYSTEYQDKMANSRSRHGSGYSDHRVANGDTVYQTNGSEYGDRSYDRRDYGDDRNYGDDFSTSVTSDYDQSASKGTRNIIGSTVNAAVYEERDVSDASRRRHREAAERPDFFNIGGVASQNISQPKYGRRKASSDDKPDMFDNAHRNEFVRLTSNSAYGSRVVDTVSRPDSFKVERRADQIEEPRGMRSPDDILDRNSSAVSQGSKNFHRRRMSGDLLVASTKSGIK